MTPFLVPNPDGSINVDKTIAILRAVIHFEIDEMFERERQRRQHIEDIRRFREHGIYTIRIRHPNHFQWPYPYQP